MSQENYGFVTVPTFKPSNIVPLVKTERPNFVAAGLGLLSGVLAWQYLGVQPLIGVPVALIGLSLGVMYVISAPPFLDAWQWTKTLYAYARKPQRYARTEEAAEHVNNKPFTTGEETREITNVKRFYPSKRVVERTDGSLVAYVEINPPHRDFATSQDWFDSARDISQWFNGTIDFDIQLYVTTERYPIESHIEQLESRLSDSDVLGNRNLEMLIEEQLDSKRQEYEEAATSVTHYYVVVSVGESEVSTMSETDQTAIERLQDIPFAGVIFDAIGYYASGQADRTERETKLEMARKLQGRISKVRELSVSMEEYDAYRLTVPEIMGLQRRFWQPSEVHASQATMQPRTMAASAMDMTDDGVQS